MFTAIDQGSLLSHQGVFVLFAARSSSRFRKPNDHGHVEQWHVPLSIEAFHQSPDVARQSRLRITEFSSEKALLEDSSSIILYLLVDEIE